MSRTLIKPEIQSFIEKLQSLPPGDRARLKRSAGKRLDEARSISLFYRLLPYQMPQEKEEIYFLVATLFPLADQGNTGNLGDSLRRARNSINAKGLDRRVEILLDSDETQLAFRLRQVVHYLGTNQVPIYWQELLQDLLYWTHPNHFVQKEWARAYFAG